MDYLTVTSQLTPQMAELYGAYFKWRGMKLTGSGRVGEGLKVLAPVHLHCIPEAEGI